MPWSPQLLGRDEIVSSAHGLLADPGTRLLTLTGLPGVGTSSVARAVVAGTFAARSDRLFGSDLSPYSVAGHCSPPVQARYAHTAGALLHLVTESLAGAHVVLVDDADLCVFAAEELMEALVRHPDARLVVTARSPLNLPGEFVVRVPPLPNPEPDLDPEMYAVEPAVRIFLAAARRTGTTADLGAGALAHIAAICAILGGNPRAIEMAAARTPTLGTTTLLARLRTSSLSSVISGRYPSTDGHDLFRAIRRSVSLLEDEPRSLVAGMSVFHTPVPLEAIEAVAGRAADIDHLTELVDAHLVDPVHTTRGSRYQLPPLVREHAAELLRADPEWASKVGGRHTEWALCVTAAPRALRSTGRGRWAHPEELTEREREVLSCMTSGASNKELSGVLGIRPKTVMHHTSNIYRKLGVRSRSQAVAWALRHAGEIVDQEALTEQGTG